MYRQAAGSWGLLIVLLSFVFLILSYALTTHVVCADGTRASGGLATLPYYELGADVSIVAGMTFLLGLVVLALSRSIPPAPERSGPRPAATDGAEFEDR